MTMDVVDIANDRAAEEVERGIAAAHIDLPPGETGDCDLCGEWSGRLINGACAPCRDKHHLP